MQPTRIFWGFLTASTVLVAGGPLAIAQNAAGQLDASAPQGDRPATAPGEETSPAVDRKADRGQKHPGGQQQLTKERKKAIKHFLIGYYAGYTDGWHDGAHDLVIRILDEQRRRAQQRVAAGRSPSQMQPGRAAARQRMRRRMNAQFAKGDAKMKEGKKVKQDRKQGRQARRKRVSLKGEIVALKTVKIQGTDIVHRVARVRTHKGGVRIVELGPKKHTAPLKLEQGKTIRVRGRLSMSGDMRILVAQQVKLGDQKVNIQYKKNLPRKRDIEKVGTKNRRRSDHPHQGRSSEALKKNPSSGNAPSKGESLNPQH